MAVLEEGPWPRARDWEVEDLRTDWYRTRLRKLVDEHEEQLTGQAPFRYGPSRHHPDPPGRGAPEEADAGQRVDHPAPGVRLKGDDGEVVKALTTSPPGIDEAADAVLAALGAVEGAREVLAAALRAEQGRTGVSANELAERVRGAMSRPLAPSRPCASPLASATDWSTGPRSHLRDQSRPDLNCKEQTGHRHQEPRGG
ncbi:hypothetical protein [Streptomyces mirabilis]|uniref:hypothetical protein n=1 Tax=Streptomyces mirabilis TaxID=68239 RepID=UPI0033DC9C6B